ncbi:hypothetical protein CFP56_008079 [Quercus suber]|uniref:Uncharacterized protein n=1 Tax=Quercus suber TaxID=58331 RepID=A0AAW0L3W7_QUESU
MAENQSLAPEKLIDKLTHAAHGQLVEEGKKGVFELPRGEESSSYHLGKEISSELIEFGCACDEI